MRLLERCGWPELNINSFFELALKIIPIDDILSKEILIMAKKYQITAYDASYIALAKASRMVFVIDDR